MIAKAPRISFHNMEVSDALRDRIEDCIDKLHTFSSEMTSCNAIVDMVSERTPTLSVHLEIHVPGRTIPITHKSRRFHDQRDAIGLIDETFHSAQRALRDYMFMRHKSVRR